MTGRTSVRREAAAVAAVLVAAGVLLLVLEPVPGLAVLAGTGAAALLQPRGRSVLAALLALLGSGLLALALARPDALLAAAAGTVAVTAGFAAVRSPRWPPPGRGERARTDREATSRDTWEALDRGEDPTA